MVIEPSFVGSNHPISPISTDTVSVRGTRALHQFVALLIRWPVLRGSSHCRDRFEDDWKHHLFLLWYPSLTKKPKFGYIL